MTGMTGMRRRVAAGLSVLVLALLAVALISEWKWPQRAHPRAIAAAPPPPQPRSSSDTAPPRSSSDTPPPAAPVSRPRVAGSSDALSLRRLGAALRPAPPDAMGRPRGLQVVRAEPGSL